MSNPTDNQTSQPHRRKPSSNVPDLNLWQRHEASILLTMVGGAIDTIGFIGLLGFFTNHVTGNLVMAGAGLVQGGAGLWISWGALPVFIVTAMITKRFVSLQKDNSHVLSYLLFAEVVFLTAFLGCAVYFGPFEHLGAISLGLTAFLGLIAFAIRNTAGKTVMGKVRPTLLMTGNTTQLGIDLSDYIFDRPNCDIASLKHSLAVVLSFTLGALVGTLLYIKIGFAAIAPFILPVVYMAFVVRDDDYRARHQLQPKT